MDGFKRKARRVIENRTTRAALCLSVAAVLTSGCAVEHRISLGDFLDQQQTAVAEQSRVAAQLPSVNIDEVLVPYRIGPGDVFEIVLTGPDAGVQLPQLRVRVDRKGQIDLPIVGSIKVGGMELEDVEDAVRGAYVPDVFQQAVCHAEIVSVETINVLVVGAVTIPGLVPLRRNERNMLYAISAAGGVSAIASGMATVRRVRHPDGGATFDLTDPVQLARAVTADPLEPGDIVYVQAAQPNMIFVGGLVNRPGPQEYPSGTTISVLQAFAAASGLRTDVSARHGTLIRRGSNGTDMHVKLDLNRIAMGEDPNIRLAAGDILWVPETWETKLQDFLNRSIFFRAGVSVNYSVTGLDFLNRRSMQAGRFGGQNLQDSFDPLGFLDRNTLLQNLSAAPRP